MRTSIAADLLGDSGVKVSEQVLRTCVHCGFCNATCPTYQLLGDERDGAAQAGEPDHYRPSNLSSDTGFVPMILRDGAVGNEEDLWAKDFSANVLRALSLVPDAVRSWKDLASAQYLSIEDMGNFVGQADRAIDRAQMEIVAGRVSSQNECFY